MKRLWLIPIVLIVIAFLLWQLWATLLIGVKEPAYKVLSKEDRYEVRKIKPYITAHVNLKGSYESTLNTGFKILADYIFGNNHNQLCMAMKLPLLHEKCQKSIRMPMTAPVLVEATSEPESYRVTFVLPRRYTLDTVPKPRDSRIILEEEPAKIVAVYPFTWYPTEERVEKEKKVFIDLLKHDGISVRSAISLARYNPPFVLPFLMRNELIVPVEGFE